MPNFDLLRNALAQAGPWSGREIDVDTAWLKDALSTAIAGIDWKDAAEDVERFLRAGEMKSVQLWSERFFLAKVERLVTASSGATR